MQPLKTYDDAEKASREIALWDKQKNKIKVAGGNLMILGLISMCFATFIPVSAPVTLPLFIGCAICSLLTFPFINFLDNKNDKKQKALNSWKNDEGEDFDTAQYKRNTRYILQNLSSSHDEVKALADIAKEEAPKKGPTNTGSHTNSPYSQTDGVANKISPPPVSFSPRTSL